MLNVTKAKTHLGQTTVKNYPVRTQLWKLMKESERLIDSCERRNWQWQPYYSTMKRSGRPCSRPGAFPRRSARR